jgi:UDP-glucose 4-epimerase
LNLGTGIGTSVKEIILTAEKISGRKCPAIFVPRRDGDPEKLLAGNKKACQILDWVPKNTLNDIIHSAWNWEQKRRF